jgi:hypothetical protein
MTCFKWPLLHLGWQLNFLTSLQAFNYLCFETHGQLCFFLWYIEVHSLDWVEWKLKPQFRIQLQVQLTIRIEMACFYTSQWEVHNWILEKKQNVTYIKSNQLQDLNKNILRSSKIVITIYFLQCLNFFFKFFHNWNYF